MGHGDPNAPCNFHTIEDTNMVVGSCLRTPADIDSIVAAGVTSVFSLQDETDLAKTKIDFDSIFTACQKRGLQYFHFATNDKDDSKLQASLPATIAAFSSQLKTSKAYVHCNGGYQRSPTIAVAQLYWIQGKNLDEAVATIQSARDSDPKINVIRAATWDMLQALGYGDDAVKDRVLDGDAKLTDEEKEAIAKHIEGLGTSA